MARNIHKKERKMLMENSKICELKPELDPAKSFYGKAMVEEQKNGDLLLKSYGDNILLLSPATDKLQRYSDRLSITAMRHAKDFVYQYVGKDNFDTTMFSQLPMVQESACAGEILIDNFYIDKPELIATGSGKLDNGIPYKFSYNFYDGQMIITPAGVELPAEKKNEIRCEVLSRVFPLVGKDIIKRSLEQVGETYTFTNGFLCQESVISHSDVTAHISNLSSKESVLTLENGSLIVIVPHPDKSYKEDQAKPYKGYVMRMEINKAGNIRETAFRTYSDAVRDLGDYMPVVSKDKISKSIEKTKSTKRSWNPVLIEREAMVR